MYSELFPSFSLDYRAIVLDPANPSVKNQAKTMVAANIECEFLVFSILLFSGLCVLACVCS